MLYLIYTNYHKQLYNIILIIFIVQYKIITLAYIKFQKLGLLHAINKIYINIYVR